MNNLNDLLYSLTNCKYAIKVYSSDNLTGLLETITYKDYVSNKKEVIENIKLYLTCEDVYFKIKK